MGLLWSWTSPAQRHLRARAGVLQESGVSVKLGGKPLPLWLVKTWSLRFPVICHMGTGSFGWRKLLMRSVWVGCGVATWLTSVGSSGFLVQEQLPESSPIMSPHLTHNMKGPAWKCSLSLTEKEKSSREWSRSHSVGKASSFPACELSAGSIPAGPGRSPVYENVLSGRSGRHATCTWNRRVYGDRATWD